MRRVRYYIEKSESSRLSESYAFGLCKPLESMLELLEKFRAERIIPPSASMLYWTGTVWSSLQNVSSPDQLPDTDPLLFKFLRSGELNISQSACHVACSALFTAAKRLAEATSIRHA